MSIPRYVSTIHTCYSAIRSLLSPTLSISFFFHSFFSRRAGLRTTYTKMLFQFPSLVALSTLSLLGLASTSIAGHGRPHRHIHRSRITLGDETLGAPKISRAEGDSVEVPASELHLLRTETSAFQQWMGAWLDLENATDRESSVALLRQEIQAYEGWMNAWLDSASSSGNTPPPPLPSSIPITLPITHASSSLVLSTRFLNTTTPSSATISVVKSSPAVTTSTSSTPGGQFFQEPSATIQPGPSSSSASLSEAQTSFITLTSQKPIESSSSSIPVATSIATVTPPVVSDTQSASATVAPSLSESAPTPRGSPPSGPGQFDAQSSRNVAVYYGQTEATSKTSLGEMCQNENTDIVILAFLTEFFGPGGFPGLNFGPACGGPSAKMTSAGASKLLDCPDMAAQIKQCQGLGKKVLLSLGGSLATSAFSSDSKATEFANQLWDLFGAGTGVGSGLRPFGDVRLDGFDVGKFILST